MKILSKRLAAARKFQKGTKTLTGRKRAVLNDFFEKGWSNAEIAEFHNINAETVKKWIREPKFQENLRRRMDDSVNRAMVLAARLAPEAVKNLGVMMACDKEETRRKACLDMLELTKEGGSKRTDKPDCRHPERRSRSLSPELASKLLAALADES